MRRPLGVLMLDTNFPRPRGDLGNVESYPFPAIIRRVRGATPENAVHRPDNRIVEDFIEAGRGLAADGAVGIVTTCGFLARWQGEIAAALSVPFAASSLIAFPTIARTLPAGRSLGIVTYSGTSLDRAVLAGAGIAGDPPIEGIDPTGHFACVIKEEERTLDARRMADDVVDAAKRLIARRPDLGAILLECANMPPYAERLRDEIGLPVFDPLSLAIAFRAGVEDDPSTGTFPVRGFVGR